MKPNIAHHKATSVTKQLERSPEEIGTCPNAIMHLWLKSYGGQNY